jgi:hypothetical protein
MRRRFISEEELIRVVKLKQAGASWLRIQNETGIPRRLAKKAYEEWERAKSGEEIRKARTEIAAEEFRYHLEDLIAIAQALVSCLHVPGPMGEMGDADKVLHTLWKTDIRKEHRAFSGTAGEEQIMRENRMLFRSLQEHTREKVRWEALEEWKEALSDYAVCCGALRAESRRVVESILNQDRGFRGKLLATGKGEKHVEEMAEGVVEALWRAVLAGEPGEVNNFILTKSFIKGTVTVFFGKEASIISLRFDDGDFAEKVADVCRLAASNVSMGKKSSLLGDIKRAMDIMEKGVKELEEMLNDLVLRPVILRTRCELCPV